MRTFLLALMHQACAVIFVVMFTVTAAGANTATMQFSDTYDPNPNAFTAVDNNQSYHFSHNIVADQDGDGLFWTGTYGFDSLTDTITSAAITLSFKDKCTDATAESVELIFDVESFRSQVITFGGITYTATISSEWSSLINDGILGVTLQNTGQTSGYPCNTSNFLFLGSTLTVSVDRNRQVERLLLISQPNQILELNRIQKPNRVPEPTTTTLILLALVALVVVRLHL